MIGDHGKTAAGTEHSERALKKLAQGTHLIVDLYAQSLEELGELFFLFPWVDKRCHCLNESTHSIELPAPFSGSDYGISHPSCL